MSGSMLAGTAEHRLVSIETELAIESHHDPDDVRSVVDQAERMCFVVDAVKNEHPIVQRVTLNGSPL